MRNRFPGTCYRCGLVVEVCAIIRELYGATTAVIAANITTAKERKSERVPRQTPTD